MEARLCGADSSVPFQVSHLEPGKEQGKDFVER
jgi:hypothetical protein